MKQMLLVADDLGDLDGLGGPYAIASSRDYVARPEAFGRRGLKLVNLCRGYGYQSLGYYVSLLAEARGHRVVPSVETTLELASKQAWKRALPELDAALRKDLADAPDAPPPTEFHVLLGAATDPRLQGFARLLNDRFRAPVLRVRLAAATAPDGRPSARVDAISLRSLDRLSDADRARFAERLAARSAGVWRTPKSRVPARWALAVLHDPDEGLPPTSVASLRHFARIAAREGVEVEPVRRRDLSRLAEFDGLFIRETTSIRNHTFAFAQRARQEGMPTIDDVDSMIRCTNKVYLWERLVQAGLPTPTTRLVGNGRGLDSAAGALGFPLVLKVPDGSFSRGVKKVADAAELAATSRAMFAESDLLLAQRYVPTRFDWRIGTLGGEPLFACRYLMAPGHWQIVRHRSDGPPVEGAHETYALADVPADVVDIAVRAAALIGDGFYGVDLKETDEGITVIEVNDNPNLEHGVEDEVGRDEIWARVARWFVARLRG